MHEVIHRRTGRGRWTKTGLPQIHRQRPGDSGRGAKVRTVLRPIRKTASLAPLLVFLCQCGGRLPTDDDSRRALEPAWRYATATAWPDRAEAIRAGIRRGARLDAFTPGSPLKPMRARF